MVPENMSMALTFTHLPVAIPWKSPRWVPRMTTRAAAQSPSTITSSAVMLRYGKPVGTALNQIYNTLFRAMDQERRTRETGDYRC
jgi:hypothetical protein